MNREYEIALPTDLQALRRRDNKPKSISLCIASLNFPSAEDAAQVMHNRLESLELNLVGTTIDNVVSANEVWMSSLLRKQQSFLSVLKIRPNVTYSFLSKNVARRLLFQCPNYLIFKLNFSSFSFGPQTTHSLCCALKYCRKRNYIVFGSARFFGPVGGILLELLTFREFFFGCWCHSHQQDVGRILRYRSRLTAVSKRRGTINIGSNKGTLPVAAMKSVASTVERIPGLRTYIPEVADAYENKEYLYHHLPYVRL